MDTSILYIQPDENAVSLLKTALKDIECEFLVSTDGAGALETLASRPVDIMLIPPLLPDMKQSNLIEIIVRDYPDVLLNICVDTRDFKMIPIYTRYSNVKQLHIPPFAFPPMAESIHITLDELQIKNDYAAKEADIAKRKEVLTTSIDKVTRDLKRQQYSYNKLSALLNPIMQATISISNPDYLSDDELSFDNEELTPLQKKRRKYTAFTCQAAEKMIRLQTTGAVNLDNIEETIVADLRAIISKAPYLTIENLDLTLVGDVTKRGLGAIWFSLWLLTRLQIFIAKQAVINIKSRYVTSTKFEITMTTTGTYKGDNVADEYRILVDALINTVCADYFHIPAPGQETYSIKFEL